MLLITLPTNISLASFCHPQGVSVSNISFFCLDKRRKGISIIISQIMWSLFLGVFRFNLEKVEREAVETR